MFLAPLRELFWQSVGRVEYWLRPSLRDSWGGPFNGQAARQLLFMELWNQFRFPAVVETGTYRGSTTLFLFHNTKARVFSVEAHPRYFAFAAVRLRKCDRVQLTHGDCRSFLKQLAGELDRDAPTFFYLDAHWEDDLPLREELGIIANAWRNPVVIIDDFRVPAEPGYRFDDYGGGRTLDLPHIEPLAALNLDAWYPSFPASGETGWSRRGCVVLARPGSLPPSSRWLVPAVDATAP
jgi:hypothetical protein